MSKKIETIMMRDSSGNIATPLACDADIWRDAGWSDVPPEKPSATGVDEQGARKTVMTKET